MNQTDRRSRLSPPQTPCLSDTSDNWHAAVVSQPCGNPARAVEPQCTHSKIHRRHLLLGSTAALGLAASGYAISTSVDRRNASSARVHSYEVDGISNSLHLNELTIEPPAFAIVPVVRFGKWVWKDPPADETGYLDPRTFEVSIGIEWTGNGRATELEGSTVAPIELDEQKIDEFEIEKSAGCDAVVRPLSDACGQLAVFSPGIERGQVIRAHARYRMTLYRNCPGLSRESFPLEQQIPPGFDKAFLGNSPGIETNTRMVRELVSSIVDTNLHSWDKAKLFHEWVWKHIEGRLGDYTSVRAALRDRVGDCEERATVFIALCRAAGIPARQVWVPNHAWAEFCLFDEQARPHWISSHTAAYPWFGWTGAHELVLQKGDKIRIPQTGKTERLVKDRMRWRGTRPQVKFTASVKPIPHANEGAIPGGRKKLDDGKWDFLESHPENQYLRD